MSTNGNGSEKPTVDELKRWAKAPSQPQQLLITESEFTPEEARTPRPISGHPVLKITLVAGLLLPVFGIAGLLLNGNHPSQSQKEATQAKSSKPENPPENSDAAMVAKQREELGRTQAEFAIAQQAQALKNQAPKQPTPQFKTALQKATVQPTASANPPVNSRPVMEPVHDISPPQIIRPPAIRSVAPPSRTESEIAAKPSEASMSPQDNYDRYLALTQLGSYGQLPSQESSKGAVTLAQSPRVTVYQPVVEQTSEPALEVSEEAPILNEQPQRSLLASTKVAGILTTPVVVDEKKEERLSDRFTVELLQPLRTEDGMIAIPARSQLIAQLNSISESGLVKLKVVSAIVNQGDQSAEIQIPTDAIQIRGKAGQPLIAKYYGDKGKVISSKDTGLFVLGALNKASELLTRSQSSSIVNSNGNVITSTQNGKPNVLAGILQGGSQALLNTITQRNREAMQAIAQQPEIRFLPAGSEVEVFVNRSMPIPTDLITAMATSSSTSELPSQEEEPILTAPIQTPIPEWSTLPHAKTFSPDQSPRNGTLLSDFCRDCSTCENSLDNASSGQNEQSTHDSSLGRFRDESQLPADW